MRSDSKSKSGTSRTGTDFPPKSEAVVGGKKKADLGILSEAKVASQRLLEATCDEFVECEDGYVVGSNQRQTCADACDGSCCEGTDACSFFTGNVCKNNSCIGDLACKDASIGFVVGSCYGDNACWHANLGASQMNNSCNGANACFSMASYYGSIGNLSSSCNEWGSCGNAARYGFLGDLTESCNGHRACYRIAFSGHIGGIMYSCNDYKSCLHVSADGEVYSDWMQNCCNEADACDQSFGDGLPDDCFASSIPSSSSVPTASPSLVPSKSSAPSTSSVPSTSFSPTKSASPSSSPIDVNQQILTTMNDIESDTNQIKSYMNQLDAKIDNSASCQSVQAEIKFHSTVSFVSDSLFSTTLTTLEGTNIFVHLTSEGVGVDADRNPSDASDILIDIFSLDDNMDEVEVSKRAITKIAPGMYVIMIVDAYPIYWMKFYVDGKEQTVAFKINA